jgi:hypothetical protein
MHVAQALNTRQRYCRHDALRDKPSTAGVEHEDPTFLLQTAHVGAQKEFNPVLFQLI